MIKLYPVDRLYLFNNYIFSKLMLLVPVFSPVRKNFVLCGFLVVLSVICSSLGYFIIVSLDWDLSAMSITL